MIAEIILVTALVAIFGKCSLIVAYALFDKQPPKFIFGDIMMMVDFSVKSFHIKAMLMFYLIPVAILILGFSKLVVFLGRRITDKRVWTVGMLLEKITSQFLQFNFIVVL